MIYKYKGKRQDTGFIAIGIQNQMEESWLWWDLEREIWTKNPVGHACSHVECSTFDEFEQHIKEHPELKGCELLLEHAFERYNVVCFV